ncbi:MAG: hypothetical protein ACOCWZ_04160 [Spirochaetota bacterium]
MLIICLVISASVSSAYFYYTTRKGIEDITTATEKYSKTLAEAFAEVAEMSHRTQRYRRLQTLFQEKIQANIIDEAFFVKDDGSVIVHSSSERAKELRGNILTEEFYYNIDLILYPLRKGSHDVFFRDYQFSVTEVPYRRDIRRFLKEYIYPGIDVRGWLVNRAVYINKKPTGTVNLLIRKDSIYSLIETTFKESKYLLILMSSASLLFSILTGIFINTRYRQIARRHAPLPDEDVNGIISKPEKAFIPEDQPAFAASITPSHVTVVYEENGSDRSEQGIKDAIPVAAGKR